MKSETLWYKKFKKEFLRFLLLTILILTAYSVKNVNITPTNIPLSAEEFEPALDFQIIFNQTAYLPNTDAHITLRFTNNQSSILDSVNLTAQIPEELQLVSGDLTLEDQTIGIGSTISNSFICTIPESANSLDLVFLIDSSGSMSEELNEVKEEVLDLVDSLNLLVDTLRIGFVMFGSTKFDENPYNDARNALDFTSDGSIISDFIAQFSPSGGWEPWGDAIHYLQELSWESTARLAILITDEPCNGGIYVGTGSHDYYFGDELNQVVSQIHELGIQICTMQAYGGGSELETQLMEVAELGEGTYVKLSSSSDELIEEAIILAENAIREAGLKIIGEVQLILDSELITQTVTKWVLVDNLPPSLVGSVVPVFVNDGGGVTMKYKVLCNVFDASGVSYVTMFYRNNTGPFISTQMNKTAYNMHEFLFPALEKDVFVEYYFTAKDILNNSATTDIMNFTADYSFPTLDYGTITDLSLSTEEFMIYLINETISDEILLGIKSTGILEFKLFDIDSSLLLDNASLTSQSSFHCVVFHEDFDGYILLQNPSEFSSTARIFLQEVSSVVDLSSDNEKSFPEIIEYNVPIIYKVTNLRLDEDWIHLSVEAENEFQFLDLLCFNSGTLLDYKIFTVISVEFESTSTVYFAILPTDSRIASSFPATISIGYGYLDDEEYWGPNVAIPGYDIFMILGILAISVGVMYRKLKSKK
ncbi:MAG: VWA domain-containing protein [Promethearchaeota archaeon]|nr:MAG: VWA domain-containing protein [Candidatus Lokiarchaeota archaeon]